MSQRVRSIIAWACVLPVAAFNLFAALMKLFAPVEPGTPAAAMQERMGLTDAMHFQLGILELIIVILYVLPRTSTVGFVLLVGYIGGALATNLTHGFTHMEAIPIYVMFALMTIGAYFRNPELLSRVLKRPVPAKV